MKFRRTRNAVLIASMTTLLSSCGESEIAKIVERSGTGILKSPIEFARIGEPQAKYTILHVSKNSNDHAVVINSRYSRESGWSFRKSIFDCEREMQFIVADANSVESFLAAKPQKKWSPLVQGSSADTVGRNGCKYIGKEFPSSQNAQLVPVEKSTLFSSIKEADNVKKRDNRKDVTSKSFLRHSKPQCTTSHGYITTEGTVTNTSNQAIDGLMVVTEHHQSSSGTFIKSATAMIEYQPLMPGQTSPFKTITTDHPMITSCIVSFKTMFGGYIPAQ